ncbi:MAG: hypothetical protein ACD_75C00088G0001 [uncultured bacterium]|nr:MAG: hypothetical protein ACD_75C00088G0001 [uncultured bacterium]
MLHAFGRHRQAIVRHACQELVPGKIFRRSRQEIEARPLRHRKEKGQQPMVEDGPLPTFLPPRTDMFIRHLRRRIAQREEKSPVAPQTPGGNGIFRVHLQKAVRRPARAQQTAGQVGIGCGKSRRLPLRHQLVIPVVQVGQIMVDEALAQFAVDGHEIAEQIGPVDFGGVDARIAARNGAAQELVFNLPGPDIGKIVVLRGKQRAAAAIAHLQGMIAGADNPARIEGAGHIAPPQEIGQRGSGDDFGVIADDKILEGEYLPGDIGQHRFPADPGGLKDHAPLVCHDFPGGRIRPQIHLHMADQLAGRRLQQPPV